MTRLNGFRIGTCRPLDRLDAIECLIWNHNEHGALLELPPSTQPVEVFHLLCSELGIDTMCRVVRREGREWAVAYAERPV